ncbi:hypothetical protein L9F63_019511, partial [Diploptera punctata]
TQLTVSTYDSRCHKACRSIGCYRRGQKFPCAFCVHLLSSHHNRKCTAISPKTIHFIFFKRGCIVKHECRTMALPLKNKYIVLQYNNIKSKMFLYNHLVASVTYSVEHRLLLTIFFFCFDVRTFRICICKTEFVNTLETVWKFPAVRPVCDRRFSYSTDPVIVRSCSLVMLKNLYIHIRCTTERRRNVSLHYVDVIIHDMEHNLDPLEKVMKTLKILVSMRQNILRIRRVILRRLDPVQDQPVASRSRRISSVLRTDNSSSRGRSTGINAARGVNKISNSKANNRISSSSNNSHNNRRVNLLPNNHPSTSPNRLHNTNPNRPLNTSPNRHHNLTHSRLHNLNIRPRPQVIRPHNSPHNILTSNSSRLISHSLTHSLSFQTGRSKRPRRTPTLRTQGIELFSFDSRRRINLKKYFMRKVTIKLGQYPIVNNSEQLNIGEYLIQYKADSRHLSQAVHNTDWLICHEQVEEDKVSKNPLVLPV